MKPIASLFIAAVFAITCMSQSQSERARIEADVRAVLTEQTAAWNRGDLESFMAGYWKSDDLVFASGDRITRGWQPTLDNYKRTYGSREKMGTLTFSDVAANVLSKDIAVVVGSWSLIRQSDNPKGKFTVIFRRLKEGWRIIHDHSS